MNELRACFYHSHVRDQWNGGAFHEWGRAGESDGHDGSYAVTVGIVEDNLTGRIVKVDPESVIFGCHPEEITNL